MADPTPPKTGKSKKLLWIILAVVVLIIAGGGGYWFAQRGASEQAAAAPPPPKPELYYALDPSIVVNFQEQRSIRFLQVGITLMSHDEKALNAVKEYEPRIRNALLLLFSSQSYETLLSEEGKLGLQQQALEKIQEIIPTAEGEAGIEAILFTSFVIQ